MGARRIGLIFAIVVMAGMCARYSFSQGMQKDTSLPVSLSEGFNPITFNVACATATWTLVIASDTISRSTFLENIPENANTICILPVLKGVLPTVAISSQCMSATQGVHLPTSAAYTDYSHAGWACASSSGTVTGQISGVRTRDSGDYGLIGASALQNR